MPRTATAFGRQFLDALLTAFLMPASLETLTEVLQVHADIGQAVERATAAMLPPVVDRRTLQAGPIDDRFRMPRYREPLGATVPASTVGGERLTVAVSCPGPKLWKPHVSEAKMAGLALDDGTEGQRIKVGNLFSEREIGCVVRSAQRAKVLSE